MLFSFFRHFHPDLTAHLVAAGNKMTVIEKDKVRRTIKSAEIKSNINTDGKNCSEKEIGFSRSSVATQKLFSKCPVQLERSNTG